MAGRPPRKTPTLSASAGSPACTRSFPTLILVESTMISGAFGGSGGGGATVAVGAVVAAKGASWGVASLSQATAEVPARMRSKRAQGGISPGILAYNSPERQPGEACWPSYLAIQ